MTRTFGQLIYDAFGGPPAASTMHLVDRVFHVVLLDVGVSFDVAVPKGLCKGKGQKITGDFAIGFALVTFNMQTTDRKMWLHDRFRKHLPEARDAAAQWWRTQCILGEEWEKHYAKHGGGEEDGSKKK